MKNVLELTLAQRRELFVAASQKLGYTAPVVEKDFWVCWTLQEVFALPGAREHLILDLPFTIAYASDIDKTRNMLMEIIHAEHRILKDPAPAVVISELVEYGIKIVACPWVNVNDYWGVYFDTIEKMRKAFHANHILIPYPQRDVHLYEHQGVSE